MRRLSTLLAMATAALLVGAVPASAAPAATASQAGAAPPALRVVEYRIPSPGVPEGIAAGSDGALWFSERYTTQIGRVTVGGRFKIFSFPANNHMSTDVTAGPDGAIWFAFPNSVPSYDTGKIGRITTAGEVTFFGIPWVSDAESITTGSDGNIWFADHVAGAIGRLTTTGTFTKFPIPGPVGTYPWQLTSGPDGALWFTDFNGHRIGRLTTAGQVSFFSIPQEDGYPDAIAPGPDGNVWFTLDDEATVGRITPAGVITEFPVAHPEGNYVALSGIAPVSRGALAFTYSDFAAGESRIGRITTAGVITTVPTPTPQSSPFGITAGPGPGVWFTQLGGPSIAGIVRGDAARLG
jgi:virginiamycin B lyase